MTRPNNTPLHDELKKVVQGNLKRLLSTKRLTQKELAERTKIPTSTLNGYIKGTSIPTPGNSEKLARVLGVTKKDIDPRFDSDAFNAYNIEEAKLKLSEKESAFFEALIEKTLSLTVEEREKFFSNIEVVLELLNKKKM